MEKRKVSVVLFPGKCGGYVAFMPLFPSCTTEGETVEESLKNAKESLELALEKPSDIDLECLDHSHAEYVVVGEVEVEVRGKVTATPPA
jgi:predicted RNase H-like HicB family nuclease